MAFETGVANNHLDLWEKLHTFLTTNPALIASGEAWDVPWERVTGSGEIHRVYRSRGAGIGRDVLVATRMVPTGLADNNAIWLRGSTAINSEANLYSEHFNQSYAVGAYFQDSPMRYWIVASGRRFMLFYKISTTYHGVYGGLFLPYADPTRYPYPLMVGGTFGDGDAYPTSWRATSRGYSLFTDPEPSINSNNLFVRPAACYLSPEGVWEQVTGANNGYGTNTYMSPYNYGADAYGSGTLWPIHQSGSFLYGTFSYYGVMQYEGELYGGGYGLHPLRMHNQKRIVGDLDGVFYVPGQGNASENEVVVDGKTHTVFQNIYNTGLRSYCALRNE